MLGVLSFEINRRHFQLSRRKSYEAVQNCMKWRRVVIYGRPVLSVWGDYGRTSGESGFDSR